MSMVVGKRREPCADPRRTRVRVRVLDAPTPPTESIEGPASDYTKI